MTGDPAGAPGAAGGSATIRPFGDGGLLIDLGPAVDVRSARRARALLRRIEAKVADDPRWGRSTAAGASVLVTFDPLVIEPADAVGILTPSLVDLPLDPPPDADAREVVIEVRYGGEAGPDLEATARSLDIMPDALIEAHLAARHEVLFLGFAPGFPYIAGLPDWMSLPRLPTPRISVPAGSVAIAGSLTGIYPFASPGGWRILGRTDVVMFDPGRDDPAQLRPGDQVRFVAR
jgi:KipI family sensor histidine kinase inhibitor